MKKQMIAVIAGLAMALSFSFVYAGDFPGSFADVAKKVTPAVVNIVITGDGGTHPGKDSPMPPPTPGPQGRPDQSAGSGVIIDSRGYIVTNNHVVEGAQRLIIILKDNREFTATVVGKDPKTDLAVVKIDAGELPTLSWGSYEKIQVGDWVLAVGSPFGLSSTVTFGIISALGRSNVGIADYEDFIQTDAAINPGNSGGALVNMKGELIGINAAIFSQTGGSEGIGFAIPSSIAMDVVDSLIKTGKVVRGWMGIGIQEITPALAKAFKVPDQQKGVVISGVNENGPAWASGIKRGDVVIGFNGKEVQSVSQMRNMVARAPVGVTAKVKVLRDGKVEIFLVKIGERPDEQLRAVAPEPQPKAEPQKFHNLFDNMNIEDLTPEARTQLNLPAQMTGVVVVGVRPGSNVEAAGLQRGDVIFEINHKAVKDFSAYAAIVKRIGEKESALLSVFRQGDSRRGGSLYIAVTP